MNTALRVLLRVVGRRSKNRERLKNKVKNIVERDRILFKKFESQQNPPQRVAS